MDLPQGPEEMAARLKTVGLRPTRQRVTLAAVLFGRGHRHLTAETLHEDAMAAGVKVSLATVYNTLHQFRAAGLVRQIAVDGGLTYFDTNTSEHPHFYFQDSGHLADVPGAQVSLSGLECIPEDMEIDSVEVVVRLKPKHSA